jgi:hypothetical protein
VSLKQRHDAGTFEGARREALLKLIPLLLLAVMNSVNNFFDCINVLEVLEHTYLQKKIHCLLEAGELALVFESKGVVVLNAQLKRLLWQSERCQRQQNEGRGSDIEVVVLTILALTSLLSVALLFAILAIAR